MGDAQSIPTSAELADQLAYTSFLFWQTLAEMETEEIESILLGATSTTPGHTAKVMVADQAFCDRRALHKIQSIFAGIPPVSTPARSEADQNVRIQEVARRPWIEVEQAAKEARQRLVELARALTPEQLTLTGGEGGTSSVAQQLQERIDVVRMQRRMLQAYCGSVERWGRAGLRRLMVEQHENFMNAMAGLTEKTMQSAQVCGVWTIRDVYAHVLGWNQYCSQLLRQWPEPNPESIREWQWLDDDTMASFNERMMAARTHLTMIEIADGLTTEYRRMMRVFDRSSDAEMASEGLTWGGDGVLSNFFYEIFVHEAEHAAQIWAFRAGLLAEEAEQNRSDDS